MFSDTPTETAAPTPAEDAPAGFAADQLRAFIERIERLEEEKKVIAEDVKDVFAEAKANGFDVKALRAILKIRSEDEAARQERDAIIDLYCQALGIHL